MQKLKALWNSLPHAVQGLIVAFVAAFGESLAHALSEPSMTFSKATVVHLLKGAIVAGVVAAKAFYIVPSATSDKLKAQGAMQALVAQSNAAALNTCAPPQKQG